MGERGLILSEVEDFSTPDMRFTDLDADSQAFVLRVFGLAELNPKTIIVFVREGNDSVRLQFSQMLTPKTSDNTIGSGESLYSRCA